MTSVLKWIGIVVGIIIFFCLTFGLAWETGKNELKDIWQEIKNKIKLARKTDILIAFLYVILACFITQVPWVRHNYNFALFSSVVFFLLPTILGAILDHKSSPPNTITIISYIFIGIVFIFLLGTWIILPIGWALNHIFHFVN